ncbi:MAG: hypothetical protein ACREKF_03085 [Candidatus Methylomirabilales bacterium]
MLKILMMVIGIAVLLWGSAPSAHGQRATEMYVPVGQSPGVSGKYTVVGKIETINAQKRTVTIAGSSRTYTATITGRTQIWLDKSKLKLTNQKGTFSDLQKDRIVEIKYEGSAPVGKGAAEWVKVQLTGGMS